MTHVETNWGNPAHHLSCSSCDSQEGGLLQDCRMWGWETWATCMSLAFWGTPCLSRFPKEHEITEESLQTAPDHHCSDPESVNQLHLRQPTTPMDTMTVGMCFFMVSSPKLTTTSRFLSLRKTSGDLHPHALFLAWLEQNSTAKHNGIVFSTSEHLTGQVSVGPFFQRP